MDVTPNEIWVLIIMLHAGPPASGRSTANGREHQLAMTTPSVSNRFPQALVAETVDLSDLATAISRLHCDEEGDSFDGIASTVYAITHEEVVGIGQELW